MAASEGLILNRRNTLRKAQAEINEAGYLELQVSSGFIPLQVFEQMTTRPGCKQKGLNC